MTKELEKPSVMDKVDWLLSHNNNYTQEQYHTLLDLKEQYEANQKVMGDMQKTFEERLEEAKIVENYSEKLKDLRIELREESFENKLLDNKEEDKNIDLLVDNLNILIDKVDVLEEKIKVEDNDKYDSDYLYVIVDDCLKDFANNKEVEEISSSDLYIALSNNIERIKDKKEKIDLKLSNKKMELNITDDDINKMKESYYKVDDFNEEIDKFAGKTDKVLSDAKDNLSDKTKLEKADKVSGLLLALAAGEMLLPMNKDAKKLIVGTTITIFLLRELLFKDKFKLKKSIKEPIVDYSNKIDKDIASIDDKINSIIKSINDIDMMISDLKIRYHNNKNSKEYVDLLIKLERMKSLLNEKLYSLLKQKNLGFSVTNAKVKTK